MSVCFRSAAVSVAIVFVRFTVGSAVESRPQPELPTSISFSLTAQGESALTLSGTLTLNQTLRPKFAAPYLTIWGIRASEFGGRLLIKPEFEFVGALDPDREICTELRALDRNGKLLYHAWELSGDGRMGPAEIDWGAYKWQRSRLSARVSTSLVSSCRNLIVSISDFAN